MRDTSSPGRDTPMAEEFGKVNVEIVYCVH
jgi:hypothetical protein